MRRFGDLSFPRVGISALASVLQLIRDSKEGSVGCVVLMRSRIGEEFLYSCLKELIEEDEGLQTGGRQGTAVGKADQEPRANSYMRRQAYIRE